MSFPGRLQYTDCACTHTQMPTDTHTNAHTELHMCAHRPLELLADSDYKPLEYLTRVASCSYQELHAIHPPDPWSTIAMVTISSYTPSTPPPLPPRPPCYTPPLLPLRCDLSAAVQDVDCQATGQRVSRRGRIEPIKEMVRLHQIPLILLNKDLVSFQKQKCFLCPNIPSGTTS